MDKQSLIELRDKVNADEKCKSFVAREWRSWGYDPDCMWWAVLDLDTMAVHWDTGKTTIPDGISGRESVPYGNRRD